MSEKDSMYKLFLGLIIAFMLFIIAESQIIIAQTKDIQARDSYELFLTLHSTKILSIILLCLPFIGIFFMLHPRLSIVSRKKSLSQLLLGILLPFFLIWFLAHMGKESILRLNYVWQNIFDFFAQSFIYQIFAKLPWVIFALLLFLILYKTIFILLCAFFLWVYHNVILPFFTSWKSKKQSLKNTSEEETGSEL